MYSGGMNVIGVIANLRKKKTKRALLQIVKASRRLGLELVIEMEAAVRPRPGVRFARIEAFAAHGVEAVIALGGDGTVLDSMYRMAQAELALPVMGMNTGSLGFLTGIEWGQAREALEALRERRFGIDRRSTLAAARVAGEAREELGFALNEVVVGRGRSSLAAWVDLLVDGVAVSRMLCDGVIVATPTGSTAYSLSAGGPVLAPQVSAMVVSVICPHTLTARPLVLPDNVTVAVRAAQCREPMMVSLDGRNEWELQEGACVEICRGARDVTFVELPEYNPYAVWRQKLGWGVRNSETE